MRTRRAMWRCLSMVLRAYDTKQRKLELKSHSLREGIGAAGQYFSAAIGAQPSSRQTSKFLRGLHFHYQLSKSQQGSERVGLHARACLWQIDHVLD
jgi:hypothetical protein